MNLEIWLKEDISLKLNAASYITKWLAATPVHINNLTNLPDIGSRQQLSV